jgi:hypothetical protein
MSEEKNPREKLQEAITDERAASLEAERIYEQLTAKMQAYQMGSGPAPTNEDFLLWSRAVERRIKMKQIGIELDGEQRG